MNALMPLDLTAGDAAMRLGAAVVAGLVLGIDRTEHGKPAGMRTTMLVCLAAAVAMVQANLLIGQAGKPAASFIQLDLMRLPLGVLTGVGFIGAGAILRKGKFIRGLTTAATLWIVTIIGLCFGGGQWALGTAATVLAWAVLAGMRHVEDRMPQNRTAWLVVRRKGVGVESDGVRERIERSGDRVVEWGVTVLPGRGEQEIHCSIRRQSVRDVTAMPAYVRELAGDEATVRLKWRG